MKKLAAICLCLVLEILGATSLHAQNYVYATGSTPFTTEIPIENGFIAVNNGEIHMEIPLASPAQRGSIPLKESLVYDSRIWHIVHNSGYSWQPTNVPNSMAGWRLSAEFTDPPTYSMFETGTVFCGLNYQQYPAQEYFQSFAWTDAQGTNHAFAMSFYQQLPDGPCEPNPEPSSISGYAMDGSGY